MSLLHFNLTFRHTDAFKIDNNNCDDDDENDKEIKEYDNDVDRYSSIALSCYSFDVFKHLRKLIQNS
jgi:hypothetical protein